MRRTKLQRAHAAIIAFCDAAERGLTSDNTAARDALGALIAIANEARPKGRICAHQNEDYPGLRCTRRAGHKGRHEKPSSGASW